MKVKLGSGRWRSGSGSGASSIQAGSALGKDKNLKFMVKEDVYGFLTRTSLGECHPNIWCTCRGWNLGKKKEWSDWGQKNDRGARCHWEEPIWRLRAPSQLWGPVRGEYSQQRSKVSLSQPDTNRRKFLRCPWWIGRAGTARRGLSLGLVGRLNSPGSWRRPLSAPISVVNIGCVLEIPGVAGEVKVTPWSSSTSREHRWAAVSKI